MQNKEEVTRVAFSLVCAFTFLYVVYNLVESVRHNGFFITGTERKKLKGDLIYYLKELDSKGSNKTSLLVTLGALIDYSTFTGVQIQINKLGYLPKIVALLDFPDKDVKQQTALLINNLSLNEENQSVLRESIPQLINILSTHTLKLSSVELFTSVLYALTNLTTIDESHDFILQHMHVLYEILHECDVVQIKLQVLKILVNISTNKKICENLFEFDAQLLHCLEPYIGCEVNELFLLRAVTCCANVLESLHRRWKYGQEPTNFATPEFVSVKVQDELLKLALHQSEDVRFHARRCVSALRTPATPSSSGHSLDELDILEVLKI